MTNLVIIVLSSNAFLIKLPTNAPAYRIEQSPAMGNTNWHTAIPRWNIENYGRTIPVTTVKPVREVYFRAVPVE